MNTRHNSLAKVKELLSFYIYKIVKFFISSSWFNINYSPETIKCQENHKTIKVKHHHSHPFKTRQKKQSGQKKK